jgi:outer membrane protein assembly factor BamB
MPIFASILLLVAAAGPAIAQLRPEPGDLLWRQEIGGQIWAPLLYDGGVLYFGTDDASFYAFDIESRDVKWQFHTGGIVRSGAEIIGDFVVFASDDGYLYALHPDSGKEAWRFSLGSSGFERRLPALDPPYSYDYRHSSPLNHGGVIYVGSADGVLYALYNETGLERWKFETAGPIRSTPVTDGRNVYFGSHDGHVYAIDAIDGRLAWRFDTGGLVQGAMATGGGMVFAGSRSASVYGLDAETGALQWEHVNEDGSWVESSPVFDDGVLYIGSSDARALYALDARTGETIWEFETGGWSWSDPVLADDVVYIGGLGVSSYYFEGVEMRPGFFAVDQETGAGLWEFTPELIEGFISGGVFSTPAIVEGVIYVGGVDGRLYALKQ